MDQKELVFHHFRSVLCNLILLVQKSAVKFRGGAAF
jgi:hypothetical protein